MATVLDLSLFQSFSSLFPILFVFAIVLGLLQKIKPLGDSVALNSIIAVAIALMSLLSDSLIQVINFMIPWFVIAFIFFILMLLIFQIFGASEKDIFSYLKGDKSISWVIIGVSLIILFAAIGNVFGQSIGPYLDETGNQTTSTTVDGEASVATGSFEQNIFATMFHPKVLGFGVIFIIMIFAIALLTGSQN
ncbi:hypothetical protein COV17_03160 [Candidatus Woesearchaeota archaeon CG10_big_fil_rev_8_21_14_0_10_36_11]|nr:MAG: hypothetical protein COV17_03160 [Candidatus Woesearchaeota archaeon CG10_big_fil_rev_8_21_14_0_10_36_11]